MAYRNTILVTAVFVAVYFAMIIGGVAELWLWGLFTLVWITAEWRFAKDSPMKLWHWAGLIAVLVALGVALEAALV